MFKFRPGCPLIMPRRSLLTTKFATGLMEVWRVSATFASDLNSIKDRTSNLFEINGLDTF